MLTKSCSYQGSVVFEDGWRIDIYSRQQPTAPIIQVAEKLVRDQYSLTYGSIQDYLAAEDALMECDKKLHFILFDERSELQGHQLLYGDGTTLMPMEILHPEVDIRFGSQNIFEIKRAVSLTRGRYHLFLHALASIVLQKYGAIDNIPSDHNIVGYSVSSSMVDYLVRCEFEIITQRDLQYWLSCPTRSLVQSFNNGVWLHHSLLADSNGQYRLLPLD